MGPGQLSHARQIDLCAQCHAGAGEYLKRPFSYRPGDILDESIALEYAETQSKFGVHSSNQLPRLLKSRCFRESKTMTCLTCHDPHVSNRGNLRLFSKRCLSCHDYHRCRLADELGDTIKENCIDCHMPKQQDKRTTFESESGYAFPLLRDHFIKSHPEAL